MANFHSNNNNNTDVDETYDVLVVGGGVVGLSILRSVTLKGWKCALVEAESDLLCWASGSNSGIACTGVDASPGTLERALIRESSSVIRGYCKTHNIPNRPCGSLVCRWSWDSKSDSGGDATLEDVLEESHDAGDTHATILSADQVKILEPNLSASCTGAVHIPGEIVVDPWLFSITYAVHARENGAKIFTNWKFDPSASTFDADRNMWTARRTNSNHSSRSMTDTGNDVNPSYIKVRAIVNACGVWSDMVQHTIQRHEGQRSPPNSPSPQTVAQWTAKPRRGQYRLFRTDQATKIQHPIQPIPTQRTKGIFVFSTLYDQIAVGPTALDQDSRTDRSVDPKVSEELATFAKKILPSLDTERAYVGDYVGIRPGTDKRDFQIHLSRNINWVAAGGIRSTGLTSSLGIGRHVVYLLDVVLPVSSPLHKIQTSPLPALPTMINEFRHRRDGKIAINGHLYRVTHPVTYFGWDAAKGIPDAERLRHVSSNYSKL